MHPPSCSQMEARGEVVSRKVFLMAGHIEDVEFDLWFGVGGPVRIYALDPVN